MKMKFNGFIDFTKYLGILLQFVKPKQRAQYLTRLHNSVMN